MDQASRDELNRILALGAESITQNDIAFLRARKTYLNKGQKEEFKKVLEVKE